MKHLTESVDIYSPFLTDIINLSLKNGIFPDVRKLAEVPLFKKADPFDKLTINLLVYSCTYLQYLKE